MSRQRVLLIRSDSVLMVESSRFVAIQPHNWGYRTVNGHDAQLSEYEAWIARFYAAFDNPDEMREVYFKLVLHSDGREYELKMEPGKQPTFTYLHP